MKRSLLPLGATALLGFTLITVAFWSNRSGEQPILASGATLLLLYCGLVVRTELKRGRVFSPVMLYALLYSLHFGVFGLLLALRIVRFAYGPNEHHAVAAILIVILSLVAFQSGATMIRTPHDFDRRQPRAWNPSRVAWLITALVIAGWIGRAHIIAQGAYFQLARTSPGLLGVRANAVLRLVEQFPLYAFIISLIAVRVAAPARAANRWWLRMATVLGVAELAYWALAGRKQEVVLVLTYPLLAQYLRTRRLPNRVKIWAFAAVAFLMFPAAFYYRAAMDRYVGTRGSPTAIVNQSARLAVALYTGPADVATILSRRLNLLESVSAAVRIVNEGDWELEWGGAYEDVALNMVPRFLWDKKPNFHYGTRFGYAAGLLSNRDVSTSVSVTYLGESYLNFAWFGWVIFFGVGAIAEWFYGRARSGVSQAHVLYYMLILSPLLYVGGTSALYGAGVIKLLLIFALLQPFLRGQSFWLPSRYPVRVRQ